MNNFITLASGQYSALINPFGAELCSLKHILSENEFIWQANKSIWPRHSPILFPFVGRLHNFEYRYNNKTYTIEQHGFARDLNFNIIHKTESEVTLELTNNAYTFKRYPFLFSFKITYLLKSNNLKVLFEIKNTGRNPMPVSFGGHPALNINNPNDAIISFENDLKPESWILEGNFISDKTELVTNGSGQILINENTFAKDAMIFKNLKSDWVKLESKSTKKSIKLNIKDWPYLGIWAKPGAHFICIEPWQGLADAVNFEGDVWHKEGIVVLEADQKIEKLFEIEVGL